MTIATADGADGETYPMEVSRLALLISLQQWTQLVVSFFAAAAGFCFY